MNPTLVGARSVRGFTIIELMVAMVLTGIALMVIVSVSLTHSRAVVRMESSVRQLEQVRLSADLLSSEIADVPRGAVLFAGPDSMAFKLPIAWGVTCGQLNRMSKPAKKKKKDQPPADDPNAALYLEPPPAAMGSPTPEGFGVSHDGVTWTFYPANWNGLGIVQDLQAKSACLDSVPTKLPNAKQGSPPPPPSVFYKFPNYSTVTGFAPPEQSVFAAYVNISYYLKSDPGGGKTLYRTVGTTVQKLAWPFTSNAGFRYRLASGVELITVPLATLLEIRAVKAILPASRLADARFAAADSLEIAPWMPLYNSR